jgi:fatty acid desaturase
VELLAVSSFAESWTPEGVKSLGIALVVAVGLLMSLFAFCRYALPKLFEARKAKWEAQSRNLTTTVEIKRNEVEKGPDTE